MRLFQQVTRSHLPGWLRCVLPGSTFVYNPCQMRFLYTVLTSLSFLAGLFWNASAAADSTADYRPSLLFREDWRETPPETPVTQDHVAHPDLILTVHGPGREGVKKSHHDKPADDPYYIWSGTAEGNWMVALTPRDYLIDLSSYAKVRWRAKQAGFRQLRIALQLENGTWLVSDACDDASSDWRIREFNIMDIVWMELHPEEIRETRAATEPDLSRVKSIGFTDLMAGGKSSACSRLDWIEVYGVKVSP